jgi:hypothetical protein
MSIRGISFCSLSIRRRDSGYFSEYSNQNNVNTLASLTTTLLFSANDLVKISVLLFCQFTQFSSSYNLLSLNNLMVFKIVTLLSSIFQANIHCKFYTRGLSFVVFNLTSQHAIN